MDRELVRRCDAELSRCIIALLMKEPFFGHFLASIVRVYTDEVATCGVGARDGQLRLYVNPRFFVERVTLLGERIAVVKHETLHLVFRHVLRMCAEEHDPFLTNVAADLVVNQFVGTWPLPASAVTLATFPDLDLAPDQTLEHYYFRLLSLRDDAGRTAAPRSAAALDALAPSWHSDHSRWGASDDPIWDAAADAALDATVARAVERVGASGIAGLAPALRRLVDAAIDRRQPRVDWRRALRLFSNSARRTRIVATLKRQSRRYGTYPGIRVKRMQTLAVVVDTSGSIDDHALSTLFSEIHGIHRAGADVHVIECDDAVQRTYAYRGITPTAVAGRGGTAFDPAFAYLRDQRFVRWDGCIYLTDGEASAPTIAPPCKLLWVITEGGRTGDHLRFGRAVRLDPRPAS